MKITVASFLTAIALAASATAAEVTAKISNVHLCCKSCVTGAEKAVGKVAGVTPVVDKDAGTIALTGPDTATVQKAADALVAAGYFGKSENTSIKIKSDTGAKGAKVTSMEVSGVHLCCAKCVTAVDDALKTVPGFKSHTATKGAKTFTVTGDVDDKATFTALQKIGLTGEIK